MFCPSCGKELDANKVCINPACPSNSTITSEFEEETSNDNDSTIEHVENNEAMNENPNNSQNAGYNENSNNNQNPGYNQNPNNNQNPGYNQNPNYNQNAGYNQNFGYNQNPGYNQNTGYNQGNSFTDKNGISPNEMMNFFGPKNTEYYMDKWTRSQENPSFISWNWPAFLFGWVWLCFRKLYAVAGIILAVSIMGAFILPNSARSILSLGIMIASGMFANQVYVKQSIGKIRNIKLTTGLNPEVLSQRLRATGGITWVPVIIISVLSVLVVLFIIIALIAFSSSISHYGNLY